ncbi:MAG: N-acyl homoserine lactonase family protein [Actinomycetota bacterium]|nr:N-acyl homoserine lactonase family protein [Actinomycetota bacterium]
MSDANAPDFVIYVIRFAHRDRSSRGEHFYRHVDDCAVGFPIDYYVWAAVCDGYAVVFDAGFTRATAERRGDREYLASPVDTLADLGVAADEVDHVVLSHLHYDHTGHLGDFPNARIWVQRRELQFWTGPHVSRGETPHLCEPGDLVGLVRANLAGRVRQVDGDVTIVPGVTAHLVGGHTAGLQILRVKTALGHAVLTADASHFYANLDGDRPYSIVDHLPSMYDAFDRINELADSPDLIVAGHDPEVLTRFPTVDDLDGLVVRVG